MIPVYLTLDDDKEIEPMDIYQLMIVNFSDPRAVVGDMDTTYIIVNDDDGKMSIAKNNHNMYCYKYMPARTYHTAGDFTILYGITIFNCIGTNALQ